MSDTAFTWLAIVAFGARALQEFLMAFAGERLAARLRDKSDRGTFTAGTGAFLMALFWLACIVRFWGRYDRAGSAVGVLGGWSSIPAVFTEGMVEVDQASGWLALEMCGRDAMGAECWIPIQRFRFSDCIRPTGLSEAYEVGIALLATALCAREERSA